MESEKEACGHCGEPYGERRRCYKCTRGGSRKTGETRQCGTCGESFYVARWKLNDTERNQGKYCSRECKHEALRKDAALPGAQKQCTMCGQVKELACFPPDKRMLDGKQSRCRDCTRMITAEWREANPERYEALKKQAKTERQKLRRFELALEQNYGLTLAEYEDLMTKQDSVCAICRRAHVGRGSRLHVDHCHKSGRVRGLLCSRCNTALGLLREDPEFLEAAIKYLQRAA